jgi:hypothetical protein
MRCLHFGKAAYRGVLHAIQLDQARSTIPSNGVEAALSATVLTFEIRDLRSPGGGNGEAFALL